MKFFLKNTYMERLGLLKTLLIKNKTSMGELLDLNHLSRTKLKRMVSEINDDLIELFGNDENQIVEDGKYDFSVKSVCTYNELFHRLKLYYLQNSLHFELVSLLLSSSKKWNVFSLSQKFIISTSYLYQMIREINDILTEFSIELVKTEDDYFQLVGLEKDIRLFLFLFYSQSYIGTESPFEEENVKLYDFLDLLKISDSEKDQVYYFYMVMAQRMREGHFLEEFPKKVSDIVSHIPVSKETVAFESNFFSWFTEDDEIIEKETLFVRLVMRMIVYNYDSEERKIILGKRFFNGDDRITLYCRNLFLELNDEFNISISENYFYEVLYYLVFMHMFLYTFPLDLGNIRSLKYNLSPIEEFRQNVYLEKITKFYRTFVEEKYPYLLEIYDDDHILYICKQLSILLNFFIPKTIKVYAHYAQNVLGEMLVKEKLQQMFNQKTFELTEDVFEADLVISDCVENESDQADYFYLYDLSSEIIWQSVYEFIQEKIIENLFDIEIQSKN